jgi:hypothetical protein
MNYKSKKPYVLDIKNIKNIESNMSFINSQNNLKFNKKTSPLSGSEHDYNPDLWNLDDKIRQSHNCYTYATSKIVKGLRNKAQPGYASGFHHIGSKEFDCKSFYERLRKDSPGSHISQFDKSCIPGFYKVFLALDPGNDYHWWRMDSNSYWSHKPGSSNVVNLDASGNKIKNPLTSNRKFSHRNYYKPCFFACVNSDLSRTLNDIYRIR